MSQYFDSEIITSHNLNSLFVSHSLYVRHNKGIMKMFGFFPMGTNHKAKNI
jgi:hypothetical protein